MPSKHAIEGGKLMKLQDFDGAQRAFEAGLKANPTDAMCALGLGRLFLAQQDDPKARRAFSNLLKIEPTNLEGQSALAMLELRGGDESALERLRAVADKPKAGFMEQYNLAQVLQDRGDFAGAHKALEKAIKLDPNNAFALVEFANLKLNQGDARGAVTIAKKAAAAAPSEWFPQWLTARALVRSGAVGEALGVLTDAAVTFPDASALYEEMFDVAMFCGKLHAAMRAAVDLRRLNPTLANPIYKQGLVYFTQGKIAEAKPLFELAVNKAPKAPEPKQGLAKCLMFEKKYDDARKLLAEANALAPASSGPANDLATLLLERMDGAGAVRVLLPVHAATPNDEPTNLNLALAYVQQGKKAQAVPHVRAVLTSKDGDLKKQAERLKKLVGA